MSNDSPNLYRIEKQGERTWAVIYTPGDDPACFVVAREGEPPEDAEQRAGIIADVMNATVDMCSHDIRDLLRAYEAHHGRRHHADWRSEDSAGGSDA